MLFYRSTGMLTILFLAMHVQAFVTMPFSFSTAFHTQELPLKKMHALCMEVWGTVDAGMNDSSMAQVFQENHPFLLSRIMVMQSMFDILVVELSKIMNENADYYDHVLSEIEHLQKVLEDTYKTYQMVISPENTYTYAISHVLEVFLQKINFLLQTRLVISPYYAFSKMLSYPKAITPLFVPTYKIPVFPII